MFTFGDLALLLALALQVVIVWLWCKEDILGWFKGKPCQQLVVTNKDLFAITLPSGKKVKHYFSFIQDGTIMEDESDCENWRNWYLTMLDSIYSTFEVQFARHYVILDHKAVVRMDVFLEFFKELTGVELVFDLYVHTLLAGDAVQVDFLNTSRKIKIHRLLTVDAIRHSDKKKKLVGWLGINFLMQEIDDIKGDPVIYVEKNSIKSDHQKDLYTIYLHVKIGIGPDDYGELMANKSLYLDEVNNHISKLTCGKVFIGE